MFNIEKIKVGVIHQINSVLSRTIHVEIKKIHQGRNNIIGLVESFEDDKVTGWVSAPRERFPINIALYINDLKVHSTWANVKDKSTSWGQSRSFYLGIRGIWNYCQKSDQLTVRVGDTILPISHIGAYKKPQSNGKRYVEDLRKMLNSGYIVNRAGDIQLSKKKDMKWQKSVFRLYDEVCVTLQKECNIEPFLIYGSLLGQVREGGFIGHDDDLDIAYISDTSNGIDAAKDLIRVAKTLKKAGFIVDLRAEAIHVHDRKNYDLRIDIFHLFFNENDNLCFPFGIAGTSLFKRKQWTGLRKVSFSGHAVYIPNNSEQLVEHIYGLSWRTPIAGFNWSHARTRQAKSGKVAPKDREKFNSSKL